MCRITILELFPLYHSARKWGFSNEKEIVRLEKEFTIVTTTKNSQEYEIDKRLFRKDGPSSIWYYENGQVKWESWYLNGKRHRKYERAWIEYYKNGQVRYESWYLNDKHHRKDGPAKIWYNPDSKPIEESWWINDRRNGSARIIYYENGLLHYERWLLNGKFHRKDGPAEILYSENGKINQKFWYLNGILQK